MSGDELLSAAVSLAAALMVALLLLKLGAPLIGQALADSLNPARDQADKAGIYDRTFDPVQKTSLGTMRTFGLAFTILTILVSLIRLVLSAGESSY